MNYSINLEKIFKPIFTAKMESIYYAVKALNSGKVESDLPKLEKIIITILSLPIDKIPIVGDTLKNSFQTFCKDKLVNALSRRFEENLLYPNSEESKLYTDIIYKVIELSTSTQTNLNKTTDKEYRKLAKKLSKIISNEFFKFGSNFDSNNIWENSNTELKRALEVKVENDIISLNKAKFILYSHAFLETIKNKTNNFLKKNHTLCSFDISEKIMIDNLNEITQIKTIEEKQNDCFRILAERTCRIESLLTGVSVENCKLNIMEVMTY
jgi:hypothetical protein